MIWHPETHLAAFQAWASGFPVREPFGNGKKEIREARNEFDALAREGKKTPKQRFEELLAETGETRQQRRNRLNRIRRAKKL